MPSFSECQLFGKVNYSLNNPLKKNPTRYLCFLDKIFKTKHLLHVCGERCQYFSKSLEFVLELSLRFFSEVGEF